ncbi:MAG TPA: penicillin-binding protein 2 [Phycisphaerae bacterium]|nr:penicillin-binding protein 2 [Phycisphaerae bacterium]
MSAPVTVLRTTTANILLVTLCVALAGLAARVGYIQQRMAPRLTSHADRQYRSQTILPARRGLIVDARGRTLAGTQTQLSIFADPNVVDDIDQAAQQVAPILGCHPAELRNTLQANRAGRYVLLKRPATEEQVAAVRQLGIAGIGTEKRLTRSYPMGKLGAHAIGFVGAEGAGLEGCELAFDRYLKGRDGCKRSIRDVRRRAIWLAKDGYQHPQHGKHVVLTLDSAIQEIAEQELAHTVEKFQAQGGSAIVVDPMTGAVIALANWPTFDPARPGDYPVPSLRNRALTDPVEPGSTFKPFVAAAALSDGAVQLNESFWCHEGFYPAARLRDHHPYGYLTFREVVIKSSNIGMAVLGERLGDQRLHAMCARFGFGMRTGIELPGESEGIVSPLAKWTRPDTTRITMGQGPIATTPLQLVRAFCALVNGGRLLRLSILKAVIDPAGRVVERNNLPQVVKQALEPSAAEQFARRVLLDVVREGTGRRAALSHWHVMGKTGTAQVPGPGGYEQDAYVSTFIGAAPASQPRLVAMVMIYRPDHQIGYYGGTVAGPAVGEILKQGLGYLGVAPDKYDVTQTVWAPR